MPIVATLAVGLGASCGSAESDAEADATIPSSESTSTTATGTDGVQPEPGGEILLSPASVAPGEILLEPVAVETEDGFTSSVAVEPEAPVGVALPGLPIPTTTAPLPTGSVGLAQVRGNEPGLYGGTREMEICDPDQLVEFLESNPDMARAWAGVHGIEPAEIRAFVDGLTPLLLTRDTRVTNHGFEDGRARPHQSVLQAGHAVLVDEFGVPRAKCSCGNPLAEPQPVAAAPIYVGVRWPGFEGSTIVVVVADEPVEEFVVVDPITGVIVSIPRRNGEELLEPETLPVSLDGLFDCGEIPDFDGDGSFLPFFLLMEDGTLYYMTTASGNGLATAMANMGPGTELEVVGTYTIDGTAFTAEANQADNPNSITFSGVVVAPDRIDIDRYGTCVNTGGGSFEAAPAEPTDPAPAEAPVAATPDVIAAQYLDLLLLDCGVVYDTLGSQGGDDTSWRFVVPTARGDADFTVWLTGVGDDVTVQPNNELAGQIAVECGFYEP